LLKLEGETRAKQAEVDMMIEVAGDYRGPAVGLCYRYLLIHTVDTTLDLCYRYLLIHTVDTTLDLCYRYLLIHTVL
jgi:hypothetical protein